MVPVAFCYTRKLAQLVMACVIIFTVKIYTQESWGAQILYLSLATTALSMYTTLFLYSLHLTENTDQIESSFKALSVKSFSFILGPYKFCSIFYHV